MIRRVSWLIAAWFVLHAQQSFEAASVRPSKGVIPWSYSGGPGTNDPGQITGKNVTRWDIIVRAYDVRPYQLKGAPSWLDSERYTIVAKVPHGASKADAREMMQTLLAARFKLAMHRETQEGRCYNLAVEKGGPRLKAGTGGESMERATIIPDGNGGLTVPDNALGRPVALAGKGLSAIAGGGTVLILGNSQPISALAHILSGMMDGPVRDATELTGLYGFSFDFAPPPGISGPQPGPAGDLLPGFTPAEPPLSIFQALREKLGLRLEIVRGPVEFIIIDNADRVPTGN
ncbi:conserved exported hypothetical protein [Candidatus Sulfopaludibacter sp. SbA3]|nr:conserved exported hypothetical protein [Candidatus Sulfopaludibacter sp. SbA3]